MRITTDGPTLLLSGDFDVRSTGEVRNAVYDHLRHNAEGAITIDLTEVDSIDLTALKVLAVASRQFRPEAFSRRFPEAPD